MYACMTIEATEMPGANTGRRQNVASVFKQLVKDEPTSYTALDYWPEGEPPVGAGQRLPEVRHSNEA